MFSSNTSAVSGDATYIEDVFSTWLYTGNNSTQTITNGIDLSTKGGLVWVKARNQAYYHALNDTARGAGNVLQSQSTAASINQGSNGLSAFTSSGFSVGADNGYNQDTVNYVSWTFRKQPKFFDVVTYTGDGSNRTIAHSLGSVPGCIIVKRTDASADWQVYHRSLANTEYLMLNALQGKATGTTRWNSTTPTSTVFSLGTDATVNASGGTYVAYLFAHDAGGFGLTGTDNVISCGSFTTDGSGNATVNLGYEPQWVMFRRYSASDSWQMYDNMRGWAVGRNDANLRANLDAAEQLITNLTDITATGFTVNGGLASSDYIYIAIRRGPMKTPTTGTSVFAPFATGSSSGPPAYITSFPVDMAMDKPRAGNSGFPGSFVQSRLTGTGYMTADSTNAEATDANNKWDYMNGWYNAVGSTTFSNWWGAMFRRAPGFFDEVCYTGTGSARTLNHNLGVVPQLMIVKQRSAANDWMVYSSSLSAVEYVVLNSTAASAISGTMWNSTVPTASVFSLGGAAEVNTNGATYVAYLFASCPGVSKVGNYTGNGSSQTIDCGFTGGARFFLVKRTNATGDWWVYDSARGITAPADPALALNSTAAEVTSADAVDPTSVGIVVNQEATCNINVNGGQYIFLAIA